MCQARCYCNLIQDMRSGRYFYQYDDPNGETYTVRYDQEAGKLTCTCNEADCLHRCASIADFAIQRLRERELCQAEAQAIEATPEYREEHALVDLDQAQQELEAARREAQAVARFGAKAYEPVPFSLFR